MMRLVLKSVINPTFSKKKKKHLSKKPQKILVINLFCGLVFLFHKRIIVLHTKHNKLLDKPTEI